jgi:hypothetical protein
VKIGGFGEIGEKGHLSLDPGEPRVDSSDVLNGGLFVQSKIVLVDVWLMMRLMLHEICPSPQGGLWCPQR